MAAEARPAQPKTVLRGHKSQVHAAAFCRRNERLLTGDADGFVVAWDLTIMRPRVVWQAHTSTILGIAGWGDDRVITHGRDNRLVVWKLGSDDEAMLSTSLPLDPNPGTRPQPWMLHMLEINTMNFCTFSSCPVTSDSASPSTELFVAVPNTLASEAIDIFHLPSQARRHTVKLGEKNGMVMALSLFHKAYRLTVAAGYENGHTIVAHLESNGKWSTTYRTQSHTQPVLSLDVAPDRTYFVTSSADDAIIKHPLPAVEPVPETPSKTDQSDRDKAGGSESNFRAKAQSQKSLLANMLTQTAPQSSSSEVTKEVQSEPLKVVRTRHSGQQDLKIRSDGKIFATAGWDSKIRMYSAKTLKEVAVLKWHQVGCYATAFADVVEGITRTESRRGEGAGEQGQREKIPASADQQGIVRDAAIEAIPKLVEVTLRDKRIEQARTAHWLAAGSKDGKVSLWDVF